MTEFNDEYFINLTMKYDERDDEIYPKWAVWCAKSDYKYYIDGKDGHFYTHVRTDEEINKEKAKDHMRDSVMNERMKLDMSEPSEEEMDLFRLYEESMLSFEREMEENVVRFIPFEQWKKNQPDAK